MDEVLDTTRAAGDIPAAALTADEIGVLKQLAAELVGKRARGA